MKHFDLIVIGTGLAGLTAARTAAEAGARVLIAGRGMGALTLFGNTIDLLSFRQADENMDVQNILVRGNRIPGSSTPTMLNPVAPIPGVTVIP